MMSILKTLTEAAGISGAEDEIRDLILDEIEAHVDEWRVDPMGNVLALKKGTGDSSLRGVLLAHMDEVGFMVVGHEANGTLIVKNVGGVDAKLLPSLRVKVGRDKMPGVFLWKPIHFGSNQTIVEVKDMRVDIGMTTKEAAAKAAPVGTPVVFDSHYLELSETTVRSKAFDDRVGCAEMIALAQGERFPFDLWFAFTVQEEVGLRGAKVVAAAVQPDFGIILECTACHEVPQDPDEPDNTTVTKMGQGPAISYMDRASIAHPGLLRHFTATAQANNIPYQLRSAQYAGGTDAGSLHTSIAGVPTLSVSVPGRYIHSPNTLISLNDYQNTIALVRASLTSLTPAVLERD